MAGRKVFFSFLGTGFYNSGVYGCEYEVIDDSNKKKPIKNKKCFTSTETRFVQRATLEWIGVRKWQQTDVVAIALTPEAKKQNWEVEGNKRENRDKVPMDYLGLHAELETMNLPMSLTTIDIPNGKDKNEMWDVFNKIFSLFEPDDEVYIDITHSFRYLPMLVFALIDYSRFLKGVKVNMVSYGNWEARDKDTGIMPLVDLTPIVTLQNWTTSAAELIHNGNPTAVCKSANAALSDFLRDPQLRTTNVTNLSNAAKNLDKWVSALTTCRGIDIISAKDYLQFEDFISKLTELQNVTPLTAILQNLKTSFDNVPFPFEKNCLNNLYSAAKWCADKSLWQPAITFLEEAIISKVACMAKLKYDAQKDRDLVSSSLSVYSQGKEDEWHGEAEDKLMMEKIVNRFRTYKYKDMRDVYSIIMETRNSMNHAGICGNAIDAKKISDRVQTAIKDSLFIFSDDFESHFRKKIFLNLSNHPLPAWTDEQLLAAREYGEMEDWAFPFVDADADANLINDLSEDYLGKILELHRSADVTVHVMGEMTLTYALVGRLKQHGIKCVASTTERCVTNNADGSKTSLFRFKRFREY